MNYTVNYSPVSGLLPHSGFSAATPAPDAVGDSGAAGYSENVIAHWDVVPYQTVSGTLKIGVVAVHIEGLASVKFSVDGGPWISVTSVQRNPDIAPTGDTATLFASYPQNGVIFDSQGKPEFWTTFDASRFTDGLHEVRAIAYPVSGVPRLLESMWINANSGDTLPSLVRYVSAAGSDSNDGLTAGTPKLTINAAGLSISGVQGNADGGIIYLLAGSYTLSNSGSTAGTVNRWLTIAPAPGVDTADVIISGSSGSALNTKLLRLSNVTISGVVDSGGPIDDWCWLDDCSNPGQGMITGSAQGSVSSAFSHRYYTGGLWSNVSFGPQTSDLIRNLTINGVGGDTFSGCSAVINSIVIGHSQQSGQHSDEWQWDSAAENVLMYGVSNVTDIVVVNSAGPTFEVSGRDVAIVDCELSSGAGAFAVYFTKIQQHVYVKDTNLYGGFYYSGGITATNVVYENTNIAPVPTSGLTVR